MNDTMRNMISMRIDSWTGSLRGKVDDFVQMFDYDGLVLRQASSSSRKGGKFYLVLGIVCLSGIPVMIAIVYLIRRCIRKQAEALSVNLALAEVKKNGRKQPAPVYENLRTGSSMGSSSGEKVSLIQLIDESDMAALQDMNKIIAIENVTIERELGAGHFGLVFKGMLYDAKLDQKRDVAIKRVHDNVKDTREIVTFFQEAMIMRDFEHENVLSLIGVAFTKEEGMPLVVVPYMANGDLRSYIRDKRISILVSELIRMAIDIAKGMEYLEFNKVVHRDLAARNCLIDHRVNVVVSDFGLSRDIYSSEYYRSGTGKQMPIRWMAPECMEFHQFTSKSDVWSFGVVVWEVMTRGQIPYGTMSNWEVEVALKLGKRLDKPDSCPTFLYDIMTLCWSRDPDERPTFAELVKLIPHRLQEERAKRKTATEDESTNNNKQLESVYENTTDDETL
jgi:hypothetical protein